MKRLLPLVVAVAAWLIPAAPAWACHRADQTGPNCPNNTTTTSSAPSGTTTTATGGPPPSSTTTATTLIAGGTGIAVHDYGPALLDLYLPGVVNPPVVVLIHGGGFIEGDRRGDNVTEIADRLVTAGYAVASIDYRLAPAHPYSEPVEDVDAALAWVQAHGDLGYDASRLGIVGLSSGANLALMAAYRQAGVDVVVSGSAPVDLDALWSVFPQFIQPYLVDRSRAPIASPYTYVDQGDPDTLVLNSTDEQMPLSQAQLLDQTLTSAGTPHTTRIVSGDRHAAKLVKNQWDYVRAWLAARL